jgi:hypothetical protein
VAGERLPGREGSVMRGENEPAAGGQSDAEDGAVEDARVEPIRPNPPGERGVPHPTASVASPGWTKRLSGRGKAARALSIALAVLVALVVLLPHSTSSLPPPIPQLLTQIPRLLTPAPAAFTTGALVRIPRLVVPGAQGNGVVPAPRDPASAYDCTTPPGGAGSGAIALWGTHDAGQTWSRFALPEISGTYCEVDVALDGAPRLVLNTFDGPLNQNAQPCAHSQFFVSDDDGVTWHVLAYTGPAAPGSQNGSCFAVVTATHLFVMGSSWLARSDDDGQTWQRADHGLPDGADGGLGQPLDASGAAFFTLVSDTSGVPDIPSLSANLWVTHDAGASWRRAGLVTWPTPPPGVGPISEVLTEAPLGGGASAPQACHCVVGLAFPSQQGATLPLLIGEHLSLSRDLTTWTPLPPLPVPGTSAERSGVYQVLGFTGDGRLLVVGANREAGVPERVPESPTGREVTTPPPRLWAWNTHSGRWELAPTALPCPTLQACFDSSGGYPFGGCCLTSPGVSIQLDARGRLTATVLWIVVGGRSSPSPNPPALYRLAIPAS